MYSSNMELYELDLASQWALGQLTLNIKLYHSGSQPFRGLRQKPSLTIEAKTETVMDHMQNHPLHTKICK